MFHTWRVSYNFPLLAHSTLVQTSPISSNSLHALEIAMEELILPRNLYILAGDLSTPSRLTLYDSNIVLSPSNHYTLTVSSKLGTRVLGRWFYEGTGISTPSSPFDLTVSLNTPTTSLTKEVSVEIIDRTDTTPVRLLAIGDSLTRMGKYVEHVQTILPNVETVGTITYEGENFAREGRGGWTFNKYFNYIGSSEYLDSPFVFPASVSGNAYKGNTADWKKSALLNPQTQPIVACRKWHVVGKTLVLIFMMKRAITKRPNLVMSW